MKRKLVFSALPHRIAGWGTTKANGGRCNTTTTTTLSFRRGFFCSCFIYHTPHESSTTTTFRSSSGGGSAASSSSSFSASASSSERSTSAFFQPIFKKIPTIPGFSPPSTLRWATVIFWYFLHPILHFHSMQYYPAKVKLDRLLEKQYWGVNLLIGITFGLALYFSILHHAFPTTLPGEYYSLKEDTDEVLTLMGYHRPSFSSISPFSSSSSSSCQSDEKKGENGQGRGEWWKKSTERQTFGGVGGGWGMGGGDELPAFLLMKAKGEVMGKLHVMVDEAEIQRQKEEVAKLLEESKKKRKES